LFQHKNSKSEFTMVYDSGLGFESPMSDRNGPFTHLKMGDYEEFYNLRYGALSRNKPSSELESVTEGQPFHVEPLIIFQCLFFMAA
jgi:hypothetical protein